MSKPLVIQEEISTWPHLRDVMLPDVNLNNVLLIIGQDNPSVMIPKEVREGGFGTPYATKPIPGWTLNGPIKSGPKNQVTSHFIDADISLQRQVEKFWLMENLGVALPACP